MRGHAAYNMHCRNVIDLQDSSADGSDPRAYLEVDNKPTRVNIDGASFAIPRGGNVGTLCFEIHRKREGFVRGAEGGGRRAEGLMISMKLTPRHREIVM